MTRTKKKLAAVLMAEGLDDMAQEALNGRYDDFDSEFPTPIVDLVNDLRERGKMDLAARAIQGEWDSTKEESDEWWEREGKDLLGG